MFGLRDLSHFWGLLRRLGLHNLDTLFLCDCTSSRTLNLLDFLCGRLVWYWTWFRFHGYVGLRSLLWKTGNLLYWLTGIPICQSRNLLNIVNRRPLLLCVLYLLSLSLWQLLYALLYWEGDWLSCWLRLRFQGLLNSFLFRSNLQVYDVGFLFDLFLRIRKFAFDLGFKPLNFRDNWF